jgi:hypothetical protein
VHVPSEIAAHEVEEIGIYFILLALILKSRGSAGLTFLPGFNGRILAE